MNTERARLKDEQDKLAAERAKLATDQVERFKKDPLGFAKEQGITYEELTKRAIEEASAGTPDARLKKLEQEREQERQAAEKAKADAEAKANAEAAQGRIVAYIDGIHGAATKDDAAKAQYALVNALEPDYAKGLIFDVADQLTIKWQQEGKLPWGVLKPEQLPKAADVLGLIESYLEGEADKLAKAKAAKAGKSPAANGGAANGAGTGNGAAPPADPNANPDVTKLVEQRNARAAAAKPKPRNMTNQAAQAPAAPARHPREGKMSPKEAIAHVEALAREGKLV